MVKKVTSFRQWIVSITAIIIIVIGTLILVAFAQGYNYDALHNQIYKTGLVLIDSNPNNAEIFLNSKSINKKTPFRYSSAPAGNIGVELKKDGYRDWLKESVVIPGEVTFVNYSILLPSVLGQKQISEDIIFSDIVQSENKKTFGVSNKSLTIYSLSDEDTIKALYVAPQSNNPDTQVIEIYGIQLSSDGQRLLFNQKLSSTAIQTLVLDTSNSKTTNLTQEFGFSFNDLRFNPKNSSELFWLESGVLKKIQISENSISSNIIDSIFQLDVEEDRLMVVKQDPENKQLARLLSYDLSGTNEILINQIEFDPKGYDILFIRSRYAEYLSLIYKTDMRAELTKNPYQKTSGSKSTKQIGLNVSNQSINPNSRFLVYNQNNILRSLDLEFNQDESYEANLLGLQNWQWYDDYHLVIQQNNTVRFLDYDGQNNYLLTPINDIVDFGIQPSQKSIIPLNNSGKLYKLYLTKK